MGIVQMNFSEAVPRLLTETKGKIKELLSQSVWNRFQFIR